MRPTGIDTAVDTSLHGEGEASGALTMWDITTPSPEAAAVDAAKAGAARAAVGSESAIGAADTAVAVAEPEAAPPAAPKADVVNEVRTTPPATKPASISLPAAPPSSTQAPPPPSPNTGDGVGAMIALLERLRNAPPVTEIRPGMTAQQQMAALQASTAMHLLHAGANMLLMQSGLLASTRLRRHPLQKSARIVCPPNRNWRRRSPTPFLPRLPKSQRLPKLPPAR